MNGLSKTIANNQMKSLSVGQVVNIGVAHTWNKHFGYSDYSESSFVIEEIKKGEVIGRSTKHQQEMISIKLDDLIKGRFELRL